MSNSFYTSKELKKLGLKIVGENVFISRKASLYSPEKIALGSNVRIDDFCILSGDISIGSFVHISAYTALYGRFGITIGDYSGLSPRCTVFSASDDFSGEFLIGPMVDQKSTNVTGGPVVLKKYVQVGAGCIILPDLTIHEGVAVGAMSLVNRELDPWGVYKGIPAVWLKKRSNKLLGKIDG
jgi:acetyltransferase-like isoleucine patch superfamily enzyme